MRLSKTNILAGLQCEKHLHLSLHHPEFASQITSPAAVMGKVVERHARLEYPQGLLIDRPATDSNPFVQTTQALHDQSINTLFEAAFHSDELGVFVDILHRAGKQWDLIEIKSGTSVKDRHIDDVAIQALAVTRAGIALNRIRLMHINKDFVYQGGHDFRGLFLQEDITEQVQRHLPAISKQVERLRLIAAGPEPIRHIGGHCKRPYVCEYKAYCEKHDALYPVAWLPNSHAVMQTLIAREIYDIRDIPADLLSSEIHQWVRNVTISGQPDLLPGAAEILTQLSYPRYYLDFESIQFAIPIWEGTSPYQQLPFQWSCHIQSGVEGLKHRDFLDTSGNDPRRSFAEAVLEVCGETGPIIVYNQSFEKRIIKELAKLFPDLSGPLLALNERMLDLLPVVKKNYYHPQMKGSWSIKYVLPCLVPELSYAELGDVQDGTEAQKAYLEIIASNLDNSQRRALLNDLREYCKLDTYAMVAIVEKLCRSTASY